MTVFFPDYSSYEGQAAVSSSVAAVVAKATEGNYYKDADYVWYRSEAARLGVPFSGYHFLKDNIDPAEQALYYFNFAGKAPCMLDVETEGTSKPTVDECLSFMQALERLGGHVWGVYFPRWYWGQVGGDLSRLTASGAVVVASEYRSFDDSNWPAPYGGITEPIWQYTSTPIDMNAFKGTAAELAAIINGDNMNPSDVWAFKSTYAGDPIDMRQRLVNAEQAAEAANAKLDQVLAKLNNLPSGGSGASPQAVAQETLAELKAKL